VGPFVNYFDLKVTNIINHSPNNLRYLVTMQIYLHLFPFFFFKGKKTDSIN